MHRQMLTPMIKDSKEAMTANTMVGDLRKSTESWAVALAKGEALA